MTDAPSPGDCSSSSSARVFLAATVIGSGIIRTLYPGFTPDEAAEIMVPHEAEDGKVVAPS